jgi:hypothetical protein
MGALQNEKRALQNEKQHNQELMGVVVSGINDLKVGQQEILQSLRAGFKTAKEDFESFLRNDVVSVLLSRDEDVRREGDANLQNLRQAVANQTAAMRQLEGKTGSGGAIVNAIDLKAFADALLGQIQVFTADLIHSSAEASANALLTTLSSVKEELHKSLAENATMGQAEMREMMSSFRTQLSSIEDSTKQIASEVAALREIQGEILSSTNNFSSQCAMLMNGAMANKTEQMAALEALGRDIASSASAPNATLIVQLMNAFERRFGAVLSSVPDIRGLVMDMNAQAKKDSQELVASRCFFCVKWAASCKVSPRK